ncbi:nucleoside hydrolase [Egbenema bharatensis]|uniref:nucleoside hydrolase n=1 Tax=Egbenema bharatensis TaxID=3463334 RepID=UPI003A8934A2
MSIEVPKIILDTDPGGDDSFTFLWLMSLAKQGLAEIVAVTSVDGNVHAQLTFAASAKLLTLGGFADVEVGRGIIGGSDRDDVEDAGAIHGKDGMGNLSHTLPESIQSYEAARSSDDILIEKLKESPGEMTIVAIAPLTNLAAAEQKSPGILKLAKEIVIMGGAFAVPGNITPEAEFNIAYDPEAAKLVFDTCDHLIVIPLDITRKLILTTEIAKAIAQVKPESEVAQFMISLCQFMTGTALAFRETEGTPGFLVHDAATLAYLFYPETLTFRRAQVWIETRGEWTRGKTLFDRRNKAKAGANAWVAVGVDAVNLLAVMAEDLKLIL